jgi:predicted nucleic acid-binding protein
MAERRGRIPSADADEFLALLEAFDIVVAGPPTLAELNEILALARELHLTAYDASYVALALNEGLPLATCDETLVAACDARGLARV